MKIRDLLLLLLAICLLENCAVKKSVQYAPETLEYKLQLVLDSIYLANPEAKGIMVHVESSGQRNISWSGAAGYADFKTKIKLEADQPALIASSIKT